VRLTVLKVTKHAGQWLPDNQLYNWRQRYVTLQIRIKHRFTLSVTENEHETMLRILEHLN
jgi:hypothetical protein